MTYLFIFVGVVLAVSIVAAALSGRYRRYDQVVQVNPPGTNTLSPTLGQMSRRGPVDMIPTPEEVTRERSASQVYDASDDLLDPRSPHHDEWLAAHTDDEPPTSE